MALNTKTSIVDALKSKGLPSSYDSRAKLAAAKGITDYAGTAAQNVKLLGLVNKGAGTSLKASPVSAAPAKSAPVAVAKPAAAASKPSQGSATGKSSDKPASVNAPANKAAVIKASGAATGATSNKPSSPVKAVISSGAKAAGSKPSAGTATYASSGVARTPAEKKALIAKVNASADGKTAKSFVDNFIPSPAGGVINVGASVSRAARLALPSSTKVPPFFSGKASPPTSNSTTIRTGQGGSVQSQPRPSRGLPAPSKALPAPAKAPPAVKSSAGVAPKPVAPKPTGSPKAASTAKVAPQAPVKAPPVPKGGVAAKTPIKAAPGKTTVSTPKASNKAAPAAKPTPKAGKGNGKVKP